MNMKVSLRIEKDVGVSHMRTTINHGDLGSVEPTAESAALHRYLWYRPRMSRGLCSVYEQERNGTIVQRSGQYGTTWRHLAELAHHIMLPRAGTMKSTNERSMMC